MGKERYCVLAPKFHKYDFCPQCDKSLAEKAPWLISFCSTNCRDIYNACADFVFGKKTAIEARKILDKCDLSDREHFQPNLQQNIEDIYKSSEEQPKKKKTRGKKMSTIK